MKISWIWPVLLSSSSCILIAQETPLITSLEGKDLYASYCSSCHGMDGKGGGPAAGAIKPKPPDLTKIGSRNRGKFPAQMVEDAIAGDKKPNHLSKEMPIWGPLFRQVERDQDLGLIRLRNVVKYLESIQKSKS